MEDLLNQISAIAALIGCGALAFHWTGESYRNKPIATKFSVICFVISGFTLWL